jgi:peptidoglycan/xylan/chitin deacetylase (PgdA/CDA1 family)
MAAPARAGGRVALTFDDGPRPSFTEEALALFDQYGASVTFFYVGQMLAHYPQLAGLAAARGHEIENHTFDHKNLARLSQAGIRDQILRTSALIEKQTGSRPRYMRPPYNAINSDVRATLEGLGMECMRWTIDPRDWDRSRTSDVIVRHVMDRVKDGSIILLHETKRTLRALPDLLSQLRKRGFQMVTVAELMGHPGLARPGRPAPPSPAPGPPSVPPQVPNNLPLPAEILVLDRQPRPVVKIHCGKGGRDEVELLAPNYGYELILGSREDHSVGGVPSDVPQWAWYDAAEVQFRLRVPPAAVGAVNLFLKQDPQARWGQELLIDHQYVGKYKGSRWVGYALDEALTGDGSLLVQVLGIGDPVRVCEVIFEIEEALSPTADTVAARPEK